MNYGARSNERGRNCGGVEMGVVDGEQCEYRLLRVGERKKELIKKEEKERKKGKGKEKKREGNKIGKKN